MKEKLKEFLTLELEEIKKSKFRVAGLILCVILLIVFFPEENSGGEEISVNKSPESREISEKISTDKKNVIRTKSDEKIKPVIGANPENLSIANPFEVATKISKTPAEIPKTERVGEPENFKSPPPSEEISAQMYLTGTAISGTDKFAIIKKVTFAGNKISSEKNFNVSVGENFEGRIVADIGTNFILFSDGTKLYIEN